MTKKEYKTPHMKVVVTDSSSILASSGSTGATGENVPWASAKRRNIVDDFLSDEEENY